jgi:hypothetical protein
LGEWMVQWLDLETVTGIWQQGRRELYSAMPTRPQSPQRLTTN